MSGHHQHETAEPVDGCIRRGPRKTVRVYTSVEDLRADIEREREDLGRRKLAIREQLRAKGLTSIAKIAKRVGYSVGYTHECLDPKSKARLPDDIWRALGVELAA